MEKDTFNGAVIPFFFDREGSLGRIIGITSNELQLGPDNIKINIAIPAPEQLKQLRLFWLEDCPEQGPYSQTACYTWLMPRFSSMPGTYYQTAVRIKPTEDRDGTPYDSDVIFWSEGRPATPGHQYSLGLEITNRIMSGVSMEKVVSMWLNGKYNLGFSRTIGDLKQLNSRIIERAPALRLDAEKRRLELEARDAGWPYRQPLVKEIA